MILVWRDDRSGEEYERWDLETEDGRREFALRLTESLESDRSGRWEFLEFLNNYLAGPGGRWLVEGQSEPPKEMVVFRG